MARIKKPSKAAVKRSYTINQRIGRMTDGILSVVDDRHMDGERTCEKWLLDCSAYVVILREQPGYIPMDTREHDVAHIMGVIERAEDYNTGIPVPDIADVKACIQQWKNDHVTLGKAKHPIYKVTDKVWVNANYLRNCLEIVPNTEYLYINKDKDFRSAVTLKDDYAECVLMPVFHR